MYKSTCMEPLCPDYAEHRGYCDKHKRDRPIKRLEHSKMYYSKAWKRMRAIHLLNSPLCECCSLHGYVEIAKDVDHIIPHRGDKKIFNNTNNLQSLCKSCHSRKTNHEKNDMCYDYKHNAIIDLNNNDIATIVHDKNHDKEAATRLLNSTMAFPK